MLSRYFFLFGLGVLLFLPSTIDAGKYNPVLRVLIQKTRSGIILRSSSAMKINGIHLRQSEKKKFQVNKLTSNKVRVNNRITKKGSVFVSSQSPIKVRGRRYEGSIEIKPYARGLYIINHVLTEDYLEGVLNAEINTKWHVEVLKAQVIIARTYALHKRQRRFKSAWHITSSSMDQVYKGVDISDTRGRFVIRQTKGLVVKHKGKLVPTFYHSNSGGITEDPGNIWQYAMPHLKSTKSPYGRKDPNFYWSLELTFEEIEKIARQARNPIRNVTNMFVSERTPAGRALYLVIEGDKTVTIGAAKFRAIAGYTAVRSLLFNIDKTENGFFFEGNGSGHGIGLSQWGAKEMAEKGFTYAQILKFYYKGIKIALY